MTAQNKKKISKVKKRDGRIVKFERERLVTGIFKAAESVGGEDRERAYEIADEVIKRLEEKYSARKYITTKKIAEVTTQTLIDMGHGKTSVAFELFVDLKNQVKNIKSLIDADTLVHNYIDKLDWQVNENSNMAYSWQGLNRYISSTVQANYWLHSIYPKEISNANIDKDFHIHDLGMLATYCNGWSLEDLLLKGFTGVRGKISCAPPKHFSAALGQCVNFLYTLQHEAAGAQAFSSFDTFLAPFIRYDKLTYKQVKQKMQEFIYNMNVPTRVGCEVPFTNITMDLVPSGQLAEQGVIIGGEVKKEKYKDFQKEMGMINRAFCEIMMEGDAQGRLFSWPIPTYNITKGFDWDNKNYKPIWEMTAKYGIPYFSNFMNGDMSPDDARSMCLHPEEEIIYKERGNIKREKIGNLVENHRSGKYDKDGWVKIRKNEKLKALSLDLETGKTEWASIVRFLRIKDNKLVKLTLEDGKEIRVSSKHLVPVLTEQGFENKMAKDVNENDYLLNLKQTDQFNTKYQKISKNIVLDEKVAKILGYFVADGNYLKESRKNMKQYGEPRGLQFTFNSKTKENLEEIKKLLKDCFNVSTKEKQDPRYNTYYLYVYNSKIARKLKEAGFEKYGRLPNILFNSPKTVIEAFLDYHFKGDGYEKRKEIHINDLELARDLTLLYSLVGRPVTYKKKKNSQRIYVQHQKNEIAKDGKLAGPTIANRVPGFLAKSTYLVPGLNKKRMVGFAALEKYNAQTEESKYIQDSDFYIVRVKEISQKKLDKKMSFFDIELDKNHLFVHSLGTITHNCCRLRIDNRELKKRGGGLFGANPLTGSIGVVTINLPRIGYTTKTKKEYLKRLDYLMDLAKKSLVIKRKFIEKYIEAGLYPYSRFYLADVKKRFKEYYKNHFNTIGILGMNESMMNFFKDKEKGITSKEGREFALEIMDHMRERLMQYQKETNSLFNLEATPGESTTYKFAKADRKKYGKSIITAADLRGNGSKAPYYTNSTHLPVGYTDDLFEVLDQQDEFQTKYTGGTVVHLFLGERMPSGESVKKLVRKVCENYSLPYFSITPTFSICPKHGYLVGEHKYCPECDRELGYEEGMPFDEK
jgi:ribonucleoside-triphosphate reductase